MMDRGGYGGYMARMGIWGEPTSGPTVIGRAMDTMGGVQRLFGNQYDNIIKKYQANDAGLQNQYNQDTLQGRIGAENTKNQTDMEYYPQMQQAKLQQDQATVNEIMSRTGLNQAQATEAAARTGLIGTQTQNLRASSNPGYAFDSIMQQYQNSPAGSPRKSYFAGLLNQMMSGGVAVGPKGSKGASAGTIGGVSGGSSGVAGSNGDITTNPLLGNSSRSTFRQGYYTDPQTGQTQTIESPTVQNATTTQNRIQGHAEVAQGYPTIVDGLKPYQGPGGSVKLMIDNYKAAHGIPDAIQRVTAYQTARKFLPELAATNARQATGNNPGIELTREFQNSMFPGLPSGFANYLVPPSVQAQANQNYLPLQSSIINSAIQQERQGYPTEGAPNFANTGESRGYFDDQGYHQPQVSAQTSQQPQQKFSNEQLNALAEDAIKRGAPRDKVMAKLKQMQGGR
jgi:hypothetical protein